MSIPPAAPGRHKPPQYPDKFEFTGRVLFFYKDGSAAIIFGYAGFAFLPPVQDQILKDKLSPGTPVRGVIEMKPHPRGGRWRTVTEISPIS